MKAAVGAADLDAAAAEGGDEEARDGGGVEAHRWWAEAEAGVGGLEVGGDVLGDRGDAQGHGEGEGDDGDGEAGGGVAEELVGGVALFQAGEEFGLVAAQGVLRERSSESASVGVSGWGLQGAGID